MDPTITAVLSSGATLIVGLATLGVKVMFFSKNGNGSVKWKDLTIHCNKQSSMIFEKIDIIDKKIDNNHVKLASIETYITGNIGETHG